MAKLSEEARRDLSKLVDARIDTIGITEVANITGVSTTLLRRYRYAIPPGIRPATVTGLRRLTVGRSDRPVPGPVTPRSLVEELRVIVDELAECLPPEEPAPAKPARVRPLRPASKRTRRTGNQDTG